MKQKYAVIALSLAVAPVAFGQFTESVKLLPSDGAANDWFGVSVAVSASSALVGSRRDIQVGHVYGIDVNTQQDLFRFVPTATGGDDFGSSVALSGTTAVVGAPYFYVGVGSGTSSAYVFDTSTGQQLFRLTSPTVETTDGFGIDVAVSGTTAIIGAFQDNEMGGSAGAAYVFDTATGQQLFKLTASDAASGDAFGISVAVSGTTAIVGAWLDDDAGNSTGSAYLFDTITGQQLFKLTASDAGPGEHFGRSVAICGGLAAIAAPRNDTMGYRSGAVYVFDTSTGQELLKLTASDGFEYHEFGSDVAISDGTIIVGSMFDNHAGRRSGAAYGFDAQTGEQCFKLIASDASTFDHFGSSVAISGSRVLIGAARNDDAGTDSGAVYVFDLDTFCPGDIADDFGTLGGDGQVSFGDFLALLGLVGPCPGAPGCDGDIADDFGTLNGGDGQVSFGDFLALLGLVGPCP